MSDELDEKEPAQRADRASRWWYMLYPLVLLRALANGRPRIGGLLWFVVWYAWGVLCVEGLKYWNPEFWRYDGSSFYLKSCVLALVVTMMTAGYYPLLVARNLFIEGKGEPDSPEEERRQRIELLQESSASVFAFCVCVLFVGLIGVVLAPVRPRACAWGSDRWRRKRHGPCGEAITERASGLTVLTGRGRRLGCPHHGARRRDSRRTLTGAKT